MDSGSLTNALVAAGLLAVEDEESTLELGEAMDEYVDASTSSIGESTLELDAPSVDHLEDEIRPVVSELGALNSRLAALYLAVADAAPALSHADRLRALPLLDALVAGPQRTDGAPDPFIPIGGDQVAAYLHLHRLVVLYVWRDDCEPCEVMRADIEAVVDEPPEALSLFAVHGPDIPFDVRERYNILGGPVTLFLVDGEVDARLSGPHHQVVIERELETLCGYATHP
ncbi:thioredoxin family protein [Haloarcula marina]|uniref:thioredoxin family protein n=1 Tax=Haloarcula marina TaxID=2961574 RepID=UPI0020B86EE9|nr:thioredoxin family protein [Halomicroarcula marina]